MNTYLLRKSLNHSNIYLRTLSSYRSIIDPSKLSVILSDKLKPKTEYEKLLFGKTFSDHMLEIDWDIDNGWHDPKIIPYQYLSISPAASALHYGIECFEGMKAYKDEQGKIRMFRPNKNMDRLNGSMTRLAMPDFNGDGLIECMKQLLLIDESWIPQKEGYSIYLRPTAIGTSPYLGVEASKHIKLYVIMSPVGPYFPSGFKPVKLYADTLNARAWPGGVGYAKVGGNYGPTILPSQIAAKKYGTSQVLWLYGEDHQITEVGAMNIFFVLKSKDNKYIELVTAPLTRGDILAGVTRDSILTMTREWIATTSSSTSTNSDSRSNSSSNPTNITKVSERWLTMGELVEASNENRLLEAFGAGTAAIVSPVKSIIYQEKEINIPTGDSVGYISKTIWNVLQDIQYGRVNNHPWSILI